jgi:putative tryptophan/tyrosine transport system substrate-binding protein
LSTTRDLDGKRQDLLIEAVPGLRRLAALAADVNITAAKLEALQDAARAHNVGLWHIADLARFLLNGRY